MHRGPVKAVVRFCRKAENLNKAAEQVINHHEQRTVNDGLRSLETRISKAQQEVEEMTTAYISAKSDLLRATIEKRMADQETFLKDLQKQKAHIELERGIKVTKQSIIAYVNELIKGDENDKEYQRRIIDNLIALIFIYDDKLVAYLTIGNGKLKIDISLAETNIALQGVLAVQTQSPCPAELFSLILLLRFDEYSTKKRRLIFHETQIRRKLSKIQASICKAPERNLS